MHTNIFSANETSCKENRLMLYIQSCFTVFGTCCREDLCLIKTMLELMSQKSNFWSLHALYIVSRDKFNPVQFALQFFWAESHEVLVAWLDMSSSTTKNIYFSSVTLLKRPKHLFYRLIPMQQKMEYMPHA